MKASDVLIITSWEGGEGRSSLRMERTYGIGERGKSETAKCRAARAKRGRNAGKEEGGKNHCLAIGFGRGGSWNGRKRRRREEDAGFFLAYRGIVGEEISDRSSDSLQKRKG